MCAARPRSFWVVNRTEISFQKQKSCPLRWVTFFGQFLVDFRTLVLFTVFTPVTPRAPPLV